MTGRFRDVPLTPEDLAGYNAVLDEISRDFCQAGRS